MTSAEMGEVRGRIRCGRPAEGEGYVVPRVSTAGEEKEGDLAPGVAISVLVSMQYWQKPCHEMHTKRFAVLGNMLIDNHNA